MDLRSACDRNFEHYAGRKRIWCFPDKSFIAVLKLRLRRFHKLLRAQVGGYGSKWSYPKPSRLLSLEIVQQRNKSVGRDGSKSSRGVADPMNLNCCPGVH